MADRTPFPAFAIDLAMQVALIWAEANVGSIEYVEAEAFGESAGKVFLAALVPFDGDAGQQETPSNETPKKPILPTLIPGEMLHSMKEGIAALIAEGRAFGEWAPLLTSPGKAVSQSSFPTPRELVRGLIAAGLTQAQIAAASKVSQAMVNKILRKNDNCRADMYRALLLLHARTVTPASGSTSQRVSTISISPHAAVLFEVEPIPDLIQRLDAAGLQIVGAGGGGGSKPCFHVVLKPSEKKGA